MDCTKVTRESLINDIKENIGLSMASFCKEIRKRKELFDELLRLTSFAPVDTDIAFRCYLIANDFTSMPTCKCCGKTITNRKDFCSRKCSNSFYSKNELTQNKKSEASKLMWEKRSEEERERIKEKVRQTNIEHWGVECNFNSQDTIEKRRNTWLEKYGVEIASKSDIVKEHAKKTVNEKYGGNAPTSSKEVVEKRKRNNIEKYGVSSPSMLDETKEKIAATNLERYGVKCVLCNDEIKEKIKVALLDKYNVDNPMKCDDIKEKAKQTCIEKYGVDWPVYNSTYKRYTFIYEGNEITYMGYERPVLEKLLNEHGFDNVENSPKFMQTFNFLYENEKNEIHHYIPDIYVKDTNTFYEVKWSGFINFDKNKIILKKAKSVIDKGFNFIFALSNDGETFEYIDYKNFIKLYYNE